jgi:precorrin-6A/cobalt-precorrin-6A reductase
MPFRVLLLAGTSEARQLAEQLAAVKNLNVIASLAGVTREPRGYPVETRTGGFGGADALERYLDDRHIDLIVNATHPFAEVMSTNAAQAAKVTGTPLLRLLREPWRPGDGDQWLDVGGLAEAIAVLPDGARALFATGRGSVAQIAAAKPRDRLWGAIRLIDPPNQRFPLKYGEFILAQPPFSIEQELAVMQRLKISHLVTKNAGGKPGEAKLHAARALGLGIVVVRRPRQPDGQITVASLPDMMARVINAMSQSRPEKAD